MATPSPTELGRLLSLSTDGGLAGPLIGAPEFIRQAILLHLRYVKAPSTTDDEAQAYVEKFCSQYLPSLVRSDLHTGAGGGLENIFHEVFRALIGLASSSLPRFIRQFPIETSGLYLRGVHILVEYVDRLDTVMALHQARNNFLVDFRVFIKLSSLLLDHVATFPSLPSSDQNGLCTLVAQYRRDSPFLTSLEEGLWPGCTSIIDALSSGATDPERLRSMMSVRENGRLPWTSCERRETRNGKWTCAELEEGQEMMACSKCIAVRYCSPQHQRADWKRHKKFCFKPTW